MAMIMMTENLATKIPMSNMMMKSIRQLGRDKKSSCLTKLSDTRT